MQKLNEKDKYMITTKQRAKLRSLANSYDTILQMGKNGMGDELIKQVNDALAAREMIKLRVLETCELTAKEAAAELSAATQSDVVQVIGSRIVLYKQNPNPKKRIIELDD